MFQKYTEHGDLQPYILNCFTLIHITFIYIPDPIMTRNYFANLLKRAQNWPVTLTLVCTHGFLQSFSLVNLVSQSKSSLGTKEQIYKFQAGFHVLFTSDTATFAIKLRSM